MRERVDKMRNRQNAIAACILMVFVIIFFIQTYYFPEVSTWGGTQKTTRYSPTAATWPRIILTVIFFLCLILLFSDLFGKPLPVKDFCEPDPEEGENQNKDFKKAGIFIGLVFGYLFFMEIIGFPLATIFFGFLFVFFLGDKNLKLWKGCLVTLGISLVIVFSFSRFLYLPLPKGTGIFRNLSNFMIF